MRISDWSSDVCSSDLHNPAPIKESGVDYPNIVAFLIVGPNGKFVLQGIVPDKLGRGEELEHQVNNASIFFAPRKVVREVEIKDSFASLNRERSEERRVGKEWVRKCRSGWSPDPTIKTRE